MASDEKILQRPPIGIYPHRLWLEDRLVALQQTIERCKADGQIRGSLFSELHRVRGWLGGGYEPASVMAEEPYCAICEAANQNGHEVLHKCHLTARQADALSEPKSCMHCGKPENGPDTGEICRGDDVFGTHYFTYINKPMYGKGVMESAPRESWHTRYISRYEGHLRENHQIRG